MAPDSTHIVCFGNELHGDDGFGPAVYRRLMALGVPPGWRLFATGSRGLDALGLFEHCLQTIIVDAAAPAGHPGRLTLPSAAEVSQELAIDGHGAGIGYLLRALPAIGLRQNPRILAVEMSALTTFQIGLSAPVEAAVDAAIPLLCQWIAHGTESDMPTAHCITRLESTI